MWREAKYMPGRYRTVHYLGKPWHVWEVPGARFVLAQWSDLPNYATVCVAWQNQ